MQKRLTKHLLRKVMLLVFLGTYASVTAAVDQPIHSTHEKQLFIDDAIIASMNGLSKTQHQPVDYDQNPVIVPDRPWEHRRIVFGSTYFFPEEGKFKCWYLVINLRDSRPGWQVPKAARSASPEAPSVPLNESAFICYAESKDGIHWEKPNLGIWEYRGSKENNIVLGHQGSHFDSTSVIYTPDDVEQPFKMMVFQGRWPYEKNKIKDVWGPILGPDFKFGIKRQGHYGWHSTDGIHFTPYKSDPLLKVSDRSMFWYDPVRKAYVGSAKSSLNGKRAHRFAQSQDFVNWELTKTWLMQADERDHPRDQIDGAYGFRYGAQYVGFVEMRRVRNDHARIDQELMVSRDGEHWQRPIRQPFIPFGSKQSWRHTVIKVFANPPIQHDGKLWIYYGGSRGSVDYYANDEAFQALSLARLRLDGFVSIDAGDEIGVLKSREVVLAGTELHINANAGAGELRVEIQDSDGNSIPGFTLSDFQPVRTDALDATIRWNKNPSLAVLKGKRVQLLISMSNGELYAIWTES